MTRRNERAPWLYRVVVSILKGLMWLLGWRVRFTGLEHIPATGPVIIVANHVSYVDPLLLGWAVERRGRMVRFLAKRELYDHWFTGPVMRGADQILVDRRGDAGAALQHAERAMTDGKLLVIFPEGTIHPSLDMRKGKTGSARLALACGAPLIPAVAWGGQQVATKGRRKGLGIRSVHEVRYGPPIDYSRDDTVPELTQRIMEHLARMLVEAAAEHPRDLGAPVITS